MTEQEIINILKENKNKGVADLFLPGEVSDWIAENFNNPNLLYLDSMGNWQYFKDTDFDDYDNVVFALPDMFDLPPKTQTGWVEFEILKDSRFRYFAADNSVNCYLWHEWSRFLAESLEERWDFTTFGGWQYEDSDSWLMTPQMFLDDHYVNIVFKDEDRVKPAVPVKIRFWRENK